MDLRSRLLAAIDGGASCRAAAERFGVAPSTAIRWQAQRRNTGDFAPKPQGGDMRSRRVEERAEDILAVWEARKDISLEELGLALDVNDWRLPGSFDRGLDGGYVGAIRHRSTLAACPVELATRNGPP
jgi:transposase